MSSRETMQYYEEQINRILKTVLNKMYTIYDAQEKMNTSGRSQSAQQTYKSDYNEIIVYMYANTYILLNISHVLGNNERILNYFY